MDAMRMISTPGAPKAIGPYSQAVACGGFLFLSGQVGIDPETGEIPQGSFWNEVSRVLQNLEAVLEAAGSSFERVVRTTVYLTDMADFQELNGAYAKFFGGNRPARSTVMVAGLPKGARVEIDVIARVD